LIALIVTESISRAGGERLAVEFFLIGVTAEVIFFFEEEEIFAAEEIGGGKSGGACADDYDFDFAARNARRRLGVWGWERRRCFRKARRSGIGRWDNRRRQNLRRRI
jgi:hypothetical protein